MSCASTSLATRRLTNNNSLTPKGRREAEALAERLAAEGLTDLYCSPLGEYHDLIRAGLKPRPIGIKANYE